ncbi:MAG: hypothetical protein PHG87_01490 [Candidatus Omnitrophica bacterium]|nr:hypothetical protein [Candidatus Omnitrophota bacterium]
MCVFAAAIPIATAFATSAAGVTTAVAGTAGMTAAAATAANLTLAAAGLAAASGGLSAYGAYQQGQSQDKYYKYLADQNAREAEAAVKTADQQTTILQNEAAQKSKELAGDIKTVKGAQKAAMGALGIYGVTADDILGDTTNKAKLDAANIRYNADIQSWAVKKEAAEKGWALNSQGNLFRAAGQQAKTASYLNIGTTLLGTAASITGIDAFNKRWYPGKLY